MRRFSKKLGILTLLSLPFLFFSWGCSVKPYISSVPSDLAMEVSPARGVFIEIGGLGTTLTGLEVRANGAPVKASLASNGKLVLSGKKDLETDTRYVIRVTAKGYNGKSVEKTLTFLTATTPRPFLSPDALVVKRGGAVEIPWNIPLASFKYELPPELDSYGQLDKGGEVSTITIRNYAQGQQYELKIIDAIGKNGYRLKNHNPGYSQKIATTTPLEVEFDPGYGSRGVSRSTGIIVTFSEPITNPQLCAGNNIFSTDPPTPGDLTWQAPNQLKFIPQAAWDYETDVTLSVKGGPDGLKGASGSYLNEDKTSYFTTGTFKAIDVNLSTQSLTLLEGGTPVFTCLISSGKAGYSTPTGEFRVYSKDRITPMGTTPEAAEFYYIPDVPFVLWFYGGYSIHGAYWHNEFGNIRSHGCVNVSVDNAEYIFGWAPVGTPVTVHY